jgi:hypothetical protein
VTGANGAAPAPPAPARVEPERAGFLGRSWM